MFDWLRRDYERTVRRLFESRGGVIEEREPPVPGVTNVDTAATVSAIFKADCERQEAESDRAMRFNNIGTRNGVSFMSLRK